MKKGMPGFPPGFPFNVGDSFGQQQDPKNPKIHGAGNLPGGKYETLEIRGAGKVAGDVEARSIRLSGAATINGDVKAGVLETSGAGTVAGRIVADELTTSGSLTARRSIKAGTFDARGAFSTGGDVEAKTTFRARGGFAVDGRIKAKEIEIELNGRCRAKALEAPKISVKRSGSFSGSSGGAAISVSITGAGATGGVNVVSGGSSGSEGTLEVETIEGDTVSLEATHAECVTGKRVQIGAGCEIQRVEYTVELKVDEKAKVEKSEKVGK
ncbi:MAG: hypothetical protein ABSE73_01900 [Planctomycetota bacterium]